MIQATFTDRKVMAELVAKMLWEIKAVHFNATQLGGIEVNGLDLPEHLGHQLGHDFAVGECCLDHRSLLAWILCSNLWANSSKWGKFPEREGLKRKNGNCTRSR